MGLGGAAPAKNGRHSARFSPEFTVRWEDRHVTAEDWIAAFASESGVPAARPRQRWKRCSRSWASPRTLSERTAAPITCYLIGQSGIDLTRARSMAEAIAQADER